MLDSLQLPRQRRSTNTRALPPRKPASLKAIRSTSSIRRTPTGGVSMWADPRSSSLPLRTWSFLVSVKKDRLRPQLSSSFAVFLLHTLSLSTCVAQGLPSPIESRAVPFVALVSFPRLVCFVPGRKAESKGGSGWGVCSNVILGPPPALLRPLLFWLKVRAGCCGVFVLVQVVETCFSLSWWGS